MCAAPEPGIELLHLVARAADGARPLRTRAACADLWSRLAAHYDTIACTLMPDHVHLFVHVAPDGALRSFAQVLAAFRVRALRVPGHGCESFRWEPLPEPGAVRRDPRHVARTIRYVHLNPCRDALCDDPLEWEWSTHRDWLGAVARPCVNVRRWSRVLGRGPATIGEWLHEYVCADASVRRYRPLADPRSFLGDESVDASLGALAASVPRVLRSPRTAPVEFALAERQLYLRSAARWTRYKAPELARSLGCHATSVRRVLRADSFEIQPVSALPRSARSRGASASATTPAQAWGMSQDEAFAMALTLADLRLRWGGRPQERAAG